MQHLVGCFRNGVFAFVSAFFEIDQQDILSRLDTSVAESIFPQFQFDITDSDAGKTTNSESSVNGECKRNQCFRIPSFGDFYRAINVDVDDTLHGQSQNYQQMGGWRFGANITKECGGWRIAAKGGSACDSRWRMVFDSTLVQEFGGFGNHKVPGNPPGATGL